MGGFLFFDTYIKSFPSYFGRGFQYQTESFFSVIKNHVTKLPILRKMEQTIIKNLILLVVFIMERQA